MHKGASVPPGASSFVIFMDHFVRFLGVAQEFLILGVKILLITGHALIRTVVPKSRKDLGGEIVLITGSAHGVGKQLATDSAKSGAKVVLWDINEEKVKQAAEEIRDAGGQAWWYVCDVTSETAINTKAQDVARDVGDVTVLINNAGILQNVPLLELDSRKIKLTFDVNVLAHFWTIRAFLPKMVENNYGHIVAISSAAGLMGHVNQSDYSATKFAVVGMMESLSEEMRLRNCNVKFTTICPVTIDTGLNHHPVTKYSFISPVLSIEEASRQIMDAVRREEFLVTLPRSSGYFLRLLKFFPHQVTSEIMDALDYCRISNAVPVESRSGQKPS